MANNIEEHMGLADEVNDARLLDLAAERLYEELDITQDDLDTVGEVDIE